MYEVIKNIKGYDIVKMVGTKGIYHVNVTDNKFVTFRTIKSAVAFIETTL